MSAATVLTLELEPDLHAAFLAAAASDDQPAEQILKDFMRAYVAGRHEDPEHDAWFRAEVELALTEANDPTIEPIPHEVVMAEWHAQRDALLKRRG